MVFNLINLFKLGWICLYLASDKKNHLSTAKKLMIEILDLKCFWITMFRLFVWWLHPCQTTKCFFKRDYCLNRNAKFTWLGESITSIQSSFCWKNLIHYPIGHSHLHCFLSLLNRNSLLSLKFWQALLKIKLYFYMQSLF